MLGSSLLTALLFLSCRTELPSEVPLGRGPLAGLGRETDAASAGSTADAGAASPTPEPVLEPAEASTDAGRTPVDSSVDAKTPPEAGAAPEAGAPASFAGDYAGTDQVTIRMMGLPSQTQTDPKARIKVVEKSPTEIALTLVDSSNGNTICTLNAKANRSHAVVTPGQACFGGNSKDGASIVKTGTADVAGAKLTFDMHLEMHTEMTGQRLDGQLDYHFDGTRR